MPGIPRRGALLAATAPLAVARRAGAQPLLTRPLRIIVPFAPGGGVDVLGRVLTARLSELLGVPVVVDNRAGGSGTVGGVAVQGAPPDGHTLLLSTSTHAIARHVLRNLPYDPATDFAPVARIGRAPLIVIIHPGRPATTIAEVVADARRDPRRWTFAVGAMGSPGHLASLRFNQLAGLDLPLAIYRGTAPALSDVAAGNAQIMIDPVVALMPLARAGQVRVLAQTSAAPSPLAPGVPTAAESGMPGLEIETWYGLWAPRGTPGAMVEGLAAALHAAVRTPAVTARMAEMGVEPLTEGPEAFARFAAEDVARGAALLRAANFQPE